MSNLSTAEQMMVSGYGIYLHQEKELDFSTRDKYRREAVKYLEKPETNESPPHFEDAQAEIQDYTS